MHILYSTHLVWCSLKWGKWKINHSVQKVWTPLLWATPLYDHSPFLSFFWTPCFWQQFFDNVTPMKYRINIKINSCGKVISSSVEDKKTALHDFFISNTVISNIRLMTWSKIITIISIKRSQKKDKHYKWKTCWVKSITASKSIHYQWKAYIMQKLLNIDK